MVETSGLRVLNLSAAHGLAVADLPVHHRDPFDRLLIAQAMTEGLAVVTADRRFAEYPSGWSTQARTGRGDRVDLADMTEPEHPQERASVP